MNTQTLDEAVPSLAALRHNAILRHNALLSIEEVELAAAECRAAGIDDSYYEDHASFLRREFCKQFGRG